MRVGEVFGSCSWRMFLLDRALYTRNRKKRRIAFLSSSTGCCWRYVVRTPCSVNLMKKKVHWSRLCQLESHQMFHEKKMKWKHWQERVRCWVQMIQLQTCLMLKMMTPRRGQRWETLSMEWSHSHWSRGEEELCWRIFFGLSWTPTFSETREQLLKLWFKVSTSY